MSFSQQQKNQIITEQYKNTCCRRALLSGVLSAKASLDSDGSVLLNLEKTDYCEYAGKLIQEFYGRSAEYKTQHSGGRTKLIFFTSKSAQKYLSSITDKDQLFVKKCPSCSAAYFKGVFLACGTVSDPKKQYSLELTPSHNADQIYDALTELGLSPKITVRKNKKTIYFKRASDIEDFCGFFGLTNAMFEIANMQIEREILNNTNRVVNCETNNIGKSVSASARQIDAINALNKHNLLSSLPDELEYTARLRMQNESLSLSQLSKLFTPPISKSGLSHRLTKIIEAAEVLLSEKN